MTTTQNIESIVTDTNHHPRGVMTVQVEFMKGDPCKVVHDGQTYHATGKAGSNIATGVAVREMATEADARLWITLDGKHVWED